MNFHILTLFPDMVMQGLGTSIIGRAVNNGLLSIEAVNIRDYAFNKHQSVDDYPYGGGAGMLMQAEPVYQAYEAIAEKVKKKPRVVYLSPQGATFSQTMAEELAKVFAGVSMNPLKLPYVANINAEVVTDCGKIEGLLVAQVSGSVRWQQSVETMIREGVDTFVEIGPGKTLTGFLRKIDRNVKAYHIGSWEEAVSVCEELKQK